MTTKTRKITAAEFWAMPGEDHRYELVDGVLSEIGRTPIRGMLTGEIGALVLGHVSEAGLPISVGIASGFQIDDYNLRFPDVHVTAHRRMEAYDKAEGPWPHFAPDVAVEVVSHNNTPIQLARKAAEYFANGAQAVWIADPVPRTVAIRRPGAAEQVFGVDDVLSGEPEIPGFTCAVAEIFAVLDRMPKPGAEGN